MKKLIATAVVAAAAYGAFAIETGVRFENLGRGGTSVEALNEDAGTYWSEPEDAGNAYNIVAMDGYDGTHPATFVGDPANALSVKTTFGKPLSFAVNAKNEGVFLPSDMGIYFDSLIKFTVCEEAPEATLYQDAKIAIWLQEQYDEDDNITGTNLVVRAGSLSYSQDALQVTQTDYVCDEVAGDFADSWHRVTIKTIADITANSVVPGFAIYVDGYPISSSTSKWDESFTYTLSEVAKNLDDLDALFPSLKQSGTEKTKITYAQFDGTGSVNELLFTATEEPDFASDEQYLDDKFSMTIGDGENAETKNFKTVQAALAYVADLPLVDDKYYTLQLVNNISLTETITIATKCNFILDLNGNTIENTADKVYAITVARGTYMTITDSSNAKTGAIVSEDAIYVENEANLTLEAGIINGYIDVAKATGEGEEEIAGGACIVAGGTLKQDDGITLADGVALKARDDQSGFYDVVPLMVVTFMVDEAVYFTTNVVEGTLVSDIVPAAPTKIDSNFTGWDPEVTEETAITEDTTFTAQWTIKTFTVTVASAGDNMTVVVTKNGEAVDYASSYTVNYGDDVSVVYAAEDGYELTGQATFTFENIAENKEVAAPIARVISYSITYDVDGIAATTYTVADLNTTIELPTASREGYTFDGWTNETYTTAIKSFTITVLGNVELYAKWTANTPAESETPEIAPGKDSVEVDAGAGDTAEGVAAKVEVQLPAEVVVATGVDNNTYQGYFTKTATLDVSTGKWTVTAEIAEEVEEAVAESAVEALSAAEPTVSIPRGLYYKITTMTSLEGEGAQSVTGLSDGKGPIGVNKPGQKKGFIKVQIGTKAY